MNERKLHCIFHLKYKNRFSFAIKREFFYKRFFFISIEVIQWSFSLTCVWIEILKAMSLYYTTLLSFYTYIILISF